MSNIIVLRAKGHAQMAEPLSAKDDFAEPFDATESCLADCVENAMDAIVARVSLLRQHDRLVREDSPWAWKQLTRIENRLEELQISLKTARKIAMKD